MMFELVTSESVEVRSEAIRTWTTMLKEAAIPLIRPFLKSPEAQTRRAAIRLMLQSDDPRTRQEALADFHALIVDFSPEGVQSRIEAARLMGELVEPEFSDHLSKMIGDDPSTAVVHEAMAAAARGKYSAVIPDILLRLSSAATKTAARQALVQYGEMAVKALRDALFDSRAPRDIRLDIPQTLSKIPAQTAMNALQGGLLDDDRSIRFKVILAIEEMARCVPDLKVDRQIIESAVMSDAVLYSQRFAVFSAIFGPKDKLADHGESLGEHGEDTHGFFVYQSTLHVPLLLRAPGVRPGQRATALVRTIDVAPTLLELLGFPMSEEMPGRSLLSQRSEPRIPSYGNRVSSTAPPVVNDEYYENLRSLGYIR